MSALGERGGHTGGIIAWRYGWQPDGKEKSITEMEYDAAGERLMFLFDRDLQLNPEKDFDPGPDRWKKQEKLAAFINRFSEDQLPAYFSENSLGQKVLDSLNKWRERREVQPPPKLPSDPEPDPPPDSDLEAQIKAYSLKADSLHATLPVAGFATHLKVPIDIEDIYVPLRAVLDLEGYCW